VGVNQKNPQENEEVKEMKFFTMLLCLVALMLFAVLAQAQPALVVEEMPIGWEKEADESINWLEKKLSLGNPWIYFWELKKVGTGLELNAIAAFDGALNIGVIYNGVIGGGGENPSSLVGPKFSANAVNTVNLIGKLTGRQLQWKLPYNADLGVTYLLDFDDGFSNIEGHWGAVATLIKYEF
jgi:hypothetical protein